MNLEREDLATLRLLEARGRFARDAELAKAGLAHDRFEESLERLTASRVIEGFRVTVAPPPLIGGDWVLGALLGISNDPLGVANLLVKRLPFVSEIIFNSGLPEGLGPNLTLLFYSRDFDTEARFIQNTPGLSYQEVYRVKEFSFPVALPISSEERALIRALVKSPKAGLAELGAALGQTPDWVRTKLDRLLWNEGNSQGLLRIQPEVNWASVANFGHFHFLVETGHRPDQLRRLVSADSFELVLGGKPFHNRYVQLEADVWGIGELMNKVMFLNRLAGVRVAGVLWNREARVNTAWVIDLVG
ncbi:MAG: hypothetical protein ABIK44_06690 [candidate division WOR-3 bacterium]